MKPSVLCDTGTLELEQKHRRMIANRLAKACGHLESVKKMIENGRDCTEILIQMAAIKAAVHKTANAVLEYHLKTSLESTSSKEQAEHLKAYFHAINQLIQ